MIKNQFVDMIMSMKKQVININGTYNCFRDMINIEDFDSSVLKIQKVARTYWYLQYWIHHN